MSKTSAASPTARRFSTTRKDSSAKPRLGGETIAGWTITPLEVRDTDPETLEFEALGPCNTPCFRRGQFDRAAHEGAVYLDVSGWGMGEVWINGHYLGSFWDEEKQQSILIPAEILAEKGNRIVVFDLKTTTPAQRCASRTNPCSNNKHNL